MWYSVFEEAKRGQNMNRWDWILLELGGKDGYHHSSMRILGSLRELSDLKKQGNVVLAVVRGVESLLLMKSPYSGEA